MVQLKSNVLNVRSALQLNILYKVCWTKGQRQRLSMVLKSRMSHEYRPAVLKKYFLIHVINKMLLCLQCKLGLGSQTCCLFKYSYVQPILLKKYIVECNIPYLTVLSNGGNIVAVRYYYGYSYILILQSTHENTQISHIL